MENALRPNFHFKDKPSIELLQQLFYDVSDGRVRLLKEVTDIPLFLPFKTETRLVSEENLIWLRKTVSKTATRMGFSEDRVQKLVLAVGETSMNAVIHGGGGDLQVSWDEKGRLAVCIEDVGTGIPLEDMPKALFCNGYSTLGRLGQGLSIVRASVDRFWIHSSDEGTTIVLEMSDDPDTDFGWAESVAAMMQIV